MNSASTSTACEWHSAHTAQTFAVLGSGNDGLSDTEAARRLAEVGLNEISLTSGLSLLALCKRQLVQPLVLVLVAAAVLVSATGHPIDALAITVLVVINTIVGVVQESRAQRAVASLSSLVVHSCTVIRDGTSRQIPAAQIVPGDVVVLAAGDQVPADARLFEAHGLLVDESMLTGESMAVPKIAEPSAPGSPLTDRHSMVHAGTLVLSGSARAVVAETGERTQLGHIANLVRGAQPLETPLTRKVASFSRTLTWAILVLAAFTLLAATLRDLPLIDGFLAAVALSVAAIPEGLPAIMTIALAVGVRRMASRNAIVRHLTAVEALGSTTFICTDKTGTLTRGEMVATELWVGVTVSVSGSGYEPAGRLVPQPHHLIPAGRTVVLAEQLLRAALLCSDAALKQTDVGWTIEGDPTEGALVVAACKAGLSRNLVHCESPRLDELPFESARKLMATLHTEGDDHLLLIVKGAPEAVLPLCHNTASGVPLIDAVAAANDMAAAGKRVLAVAVQRISWTGRPIDEHLEEESFQLAGLVGMLDPPRAEAARAVADCHNAGIHVVMVTGDHPLTAAAIAAAVGIGSGPGSRVIAGPALAELDDAELEAAARQDSIFARVAPEDKIRLVRVLQHAGEIVAMTGDGVNDAPALRQADVGVAMGKAGTDVSRDASDIILRDDNFATIEAAVREGRRVYDNIIKSIIFVLPTNGGEALLIMAAIAAGLTLPVLPLQILWINLVTAVALALPQAFEHEERDVMSRPPRRPSQPILDRLAWERIVLVAAFMFVHTLAVFEWARWTGAPLDQARTAAVTTVVIAEAFYLFTCRSLLRPAWSVGMFSNPWIFLGVGVVLALQIAFAHTTAFNQLFHSAPLNVEQWAVAAASAALVVPLVAAHKAYRRRIEVGSGTRTMRVFRAPWHQNTDAGSRHDGDALGDANPRRRTP